MIKRTYSTLFAVVAFAAVVSTQASTGKALNTTREVEKHYRDCLESKHTDKAIRACSDVIASDLIWDVNQGAQTSVPLWARVDAHKRRGQLYYDLGQFERASGDFKEAVHLNPRDAEARFFLGLDWLRRRDTTRALEMLDAAVDADPAFARALLVRAGLLVIKGDTVGAEADINRAMELDPAEAERLERTAPHDPVYRELLHSARVARELRRQGFDDFAITLRRVLDASSTGFLTLAMPGHAPTARFGAQARVTLAGAATCVISVQRVYTCTFGSLPRTKASDLRRDLVGRIQRALPPGWMAALPLGEPVLDAGVVFRHRTTSAMIRVDTRDVVGPVSQNVQISIHP